MKQQLPLLLIGYGEQLTHNIASQLTQLQLDWLVCPIPGRVELTHTLAHHSYLAAVVINPQLSWASPLELLTQLYAQCPQTSFVFYTNQYTNELAQKAFALGLTEYILAVGELSGAELRPLWHKLQAHKAPSSVQQLQELEAVLDIAHSLGGILDTSILLERIYQKIDQLIRPELFIAVLYDEVQEEYEVALAMESGRPMKDLIPQLRLSVHDGGLTGWLMLNRTSVFIQDLDKETPPQPLRPIASLTPRSWLGIPLLMQERVLGAISIQSYRPYAFQDQHVRLMEALATQFALTLETARLYQVEARRRQAAELLHDLTSFLTQTTTKDEILNKAVTLIPHFIPDISLSLINILDKTKTYAFSEALWAAGPQYILTPIGTPVPLEQTHATRQVVETKQRVAYPDLWQITMANERSRRLLDTGIRAVLYLPMMVDEEVIGVLSLNVFHRPRTFHPDEIAFAEAVANHAAIAIHKARLIEAEQQQFRLTHSLREMGTLLTSTLSLTEVLEQLFDLLAQIVPYDTATVRLIDPHNPQQVYLAACRGINDLDRASQIIREVGLRDLARMGKQPYQIIADTRVYNDWVVSEGVGVILSTIQYPLYFKDKLIGILSIDSYQPHSFDENAAEAVLAFANQAVVAIENARLYQELQQRVQELSIINEVALVSATATNLDQLIANTTHIITNHLYQEHFGFLLVDSAHQYLVTHESYHSRNPDRWLRMFPLREEFHSIVTHVGRYGEPYILYTPAGDPHYLALEEHTQSEIAVPLKSKGTVIGVINAESSKPYAFSESDLNFLLTLAGQLETAIERTRLHENSLFYAAQLEDKVNHRTLELMSERDRIRSILDSAGEGIVFTDTFLNIIYVNPAVTWQSGYGRGELEGHNLQILHSPTNPPEIYEKIWGLVYNGQQWRGELINQRKDHTTYTVSVTLTPLYDAHNQLNGFVVIQSDITHLKEVERLKSEFVTNVSHELRTPLTNIKTYLTLLKKGRAEKHDYYLEVLFRETERLTRLIQDLLDLSRLDNDRTVIRPEQFEIGALLGQLVEEYQPKAEAKHIHLLVQQESNLPLVLADKGQLQQVLINLIANAIAYTPDHGRVTIFALVGVHLNEPMLCLKIQDSGLGIPAEELPHLFNRFFRGAAARHSRTPGTGLGLAISQEIIHRHKGHIEVASQEGQGTTFTIWLPIAPDQTIMIH